MNYREMNSEDKIRFVEGISPELRKRILGYASRSFLGIKPSWERLQNFSESEDLNWLWKQVSSPDQQIALFENLMYLHAEASESSRKKISLEQKAGKDLLKHLKHCSSILQKNPELKHAINKGIERIFADQKTQKNKEKQIKAFLTRIISHDENSEDDASLYYECALLGLFGIDYFDMIIFSIDRLIKTELSKENFIPLTTNDDKRKSPYLEKKVKKLLEDAGVTKFLPARTKEVMIAMGWKKENSKEDKKEKN